MKILRKNMYLYRRWRNEKKHTTLRKVHDFRILQWFTKYEPIITNWSCWSVKCFTVDKYQLVERISNLCFLWMNSRVKSNKTQRISDMSRDMFILLVHFLCLRNGKVDLFICLFFRVCVCVFTCSGHFFHYNDLPK